MSKLMKEVVFYTFFLKVGIVVLISAVLLKTAVIGLVVNSIHLALAHNIDSTSAVDSAAIEKNEKRDLPLLRFSEWVEVAPIWISSNHRVQASMGDVFFFGLGEPIDAFPYWENALQVGGLSLVQQYALAAAYAAFGNWQESSRASMDFSDALYLARHFASMEQWESAIDEYRASAVGREYLTGVFIALRDREIKRALANYYDSKSQSAARIYAGEYWLQIQDYERAADLARELLVEEETLDRDVRGRAYWFLARQAEFLKDNERALEFYDLAVQNNPQLVDAALGIARLESFENDLSVETQEVLGRITPAHFVEGASYGVIGYDTVTPSSVDLSLRHSTQYIVLLERNVIDSICTCDTTPSYGLCDEVEILCTSDKVFISFSRPNLISNGGFDVWRNEKPVTWAQMYSSSRTEQCVLATIKTEGLALQLATYAHNRFCGVRSGHISVEPKGAYLFVFDTMIEKDVNLITGGVWHHDDGTFTTWDYTVRAGETWKQNAIAISVPEGVKQGTVYFSNYDSVGVAYLDNVGLIQIPLLYGEGE
jgi:tetratricopeptide (TPR) repeat protein